MYSARSRAKSAELSDEQLARFESVLREVYASPLRQETRASLAKFTKTLPLFTSSEVSAPRVRPGEPVPHYLLESAGEGTVFLETVVARDGSVSAVHVLGGDSRLARPFLDALRRERYEPGRFRGRPVAVSIYRLISHMEVWGT